MKVLVAGASGFVGSRLCPALVAAGHEVAAMTRRPDRYAGAGRPVLGDVQIGFVERHRFNQVCVALEDLSHIPGHGPIPGEIWSYKSRIWT